MEKIIEAKIITVEKQKYSVAIRTGWSKKGDVGICAVRYTYWSWVEYPDMDSARKDYEKMQDGVLLSPHKERLAWITDDMIKRGEP